jgi:hypothetical protein
MLQQISASTEKTEVLTHPRYELRHRDRYAVVWDRVTRQERYASVIEQAARDVRNYLNDPAAPALPGW